METMVNNAAVFRRSVVSDSQRPRGLQPARLLCPWDFPGKNYWSRLPCLPPGDPPDPGTKPASPASLASQTNSLPLSHRGRPCTAYLKVAKRVDLKSSHHERKKTFCNRVYLWVFTGHGGGHFMRYTNTQSLCGDPETNTVLYVNCPSVFKNLILFAAAAAKSHQSCPTLCDPIDGSPPGFPIPGILQARTLEWVAISFSNA